MKALRFCYLYLFWATIILLGMYLSEEICYFRDTRPFCSPLANVTFLRIRDDRLGHGYFGAPRSGNRRHLGVDLLAQEGEPVVAVRSGFAQVAYQQGMGTFVKVMHPDGLQTIYGHLSETYLPGKTRVRQGQVIGSVGKSGNAFHRAILPHLHFEIRNGKRALDPTPLLEKALTMP